MRTSSLPRMLVFLLSCTSTVILVLITVVALTMVAVTAAICFYFGLAYALTPAILAAGLLSACWIFGAKIIDLGLESIRYRPVGWTVWTSNTDPARHVSISAPLRRLGLRLRPIVEAVRVKSGTLPIACIRVTKGCGFSAHINEQDAVVEIGIFALLILDESEVGAIIGHEIGHIMDERGGNGQHEQYLHTYSLHSVLSMEWRKICQGRASRDQEAPSKVERFLLSRVGIWIRRTVQRVAVELGEDAFFRPAIYLARRFRDRKVDKAERQSCEFRCDQVAARVTSPSTVASALARYNAAWMAYGAHRVELSEPQYRSSLRRALEGAAELARLYSAGDVPETRTAAQWVLAHAPEHHPPLAGRIEALCPGSHLLHEPWSLPLAQPIVSLEEALEALTWMLERELDEHRVRGDAGLFFEREALLNFTDGPDCELRGRLSKLENVLRGKSDVLALSLDIRKSQPHRRKARGAGGEPLRRRPAHRSVQ